MGGARRTGTVDTAVPTGSDRTGPSRTPRRRRRVLAGVVIVVVVLLGLGLVGGGWYYSNQLLDYPDGDADDVMAAQMDALAVDGIAAQTVAIDGPLGAYDGIEVPGSDDTWVVVVHGRGAPLTEAAALVPTLAAGDRPVLLTSFRNDGYAPDDPDGYSTFGDREWQDLQAWVDAAQERGARSLVLVGTSLGGAVVSSFLQQSPDARDVVAVVLDSPVLSMQATLELQAAAFGIPEPVVPALLVATKAVSDLRSGMDFAALEHVERWDVDVPVLLVHSRDDDVVPAAPTVELAERLGDDATLVLLDDVGHAGYRSVDIDAYGATLDRFLAGSVP